MNRGSSNTAASRIKLNSNLQFMPPLFIAALIVLTVVSCQLARRHVYADGFFRGWSMDGRMPGLLILTSSKVNTWIFARSLLTAALLGYYQGIAGGRAYTAYYLSVLTGAAVIRAIRVKHSFDNVQGFLCNRFGGGGVDFKGEIRCLWQGPALYRH
jgi:hypothetical protein